MAEILDYFESKDELESIKKELETAKDRIRILEKKVQTHKNRVGLWREKYKKLYIKVYRINPIPSRGEEAEKTIEEIMRNGFEGYIKNQYPAVMKKHHLSRIYIHNLWSKVARKLKNKASKDEKI